MSRYTSLQKKERRDILQKAVLAMLATGVMAWPSFSPVYAESDYTRLDNGTNVTNGNVTDIYVGKVSGNNGVNVFKKFTVESNDIANMRFNQQGQNVHVNNLLNMVQERISVSGTVNALRNGKIGGNLYFISPNGMVVNSGGAINTGSLTVMTPTMDFFNYIRKEMKEVDKEGGGTEQKEVDVTYNIFTNEFKWKKNATETSTGTLTEETAAWLAKSGTETDAKTFGELWLAGTMDGNAASDTNLTRENMMVKAEVPLNASGSIMINGIVRASTGMNLQAANILVGTDGTTTYANTELKTGVDFSSIVNVDSLSGAQGGDSILTATKDAEGNVVLTDASGLTGDGAIKITAQANDLNKSSGSIATYLAYDPSTGLGKDLLQKIFGVTCNDTVSASITLAAGNITSIGDVNMTAEAVMNQKAAKDSFRSLFANTEATISLLGGAVKADGDVNMSAASTANFTAMEAMGLVDILTLNDSYWGAAANKISAIIKKMRGQSDTSDQITTGDKVKEFFNAIQVGFGFVTSNANITVADGAKVTAGGSISAAAGATATSDMSYATGPAAIVKERNNNNENNNDGSQDSDEGNQPATYQPPFNTRMVWENVENKAVVEIQGKLTAGDEGSINLTADAVNNTVMKTAINAPEEGGVGSNYFNLAFNLLTQYNDAQVIVGRPAGVIVGGTALPENVGEIITGGAVDIKANTTYSTDIQAIVLQDERAVSSTAFNWLDLDSKAVADIYGDITAKGTLGIAANNTAEKLYITANNAMGKDEMEAKGLLRNIGAKVKETNVGSHVSGFIDNIFTKIKGDAEADIDPMKQAGYEMQGKNGGADNNWSKNLALGSAVAVLDVDNRADVNIHDKSQLVSGDDAASTVEGKTVTVHGLTLNANSVLKDTFINVRSNLLNIDGSKAKVGASGAAGVILLNNNSNITLFAGTTTDGEYASLKTTGTMDINSYSAYEWERYKVMKANVEKEAKATKELLKQYKTLVETACKNTVNKVKEIDLNVFDNIQLPELNMSDGADFNALQNFANQLKNVAEQLKTQINSVKTQLDDVVNTAKTEFNNMSEGIKKNTANLEVQIGRLYNVSEQFVDAANYAQIQVGSGVKVKDGGNNTTAVTATGSVIVEQMRNSAAVVIGKNAKLETGKDMNIAAANKQVSVAIDGKFKFIPTFNDTNSGGKVGLGGSVAVDINHASATVMVAEGAALNTQGNLTVTADNDLNNIAVVNGGAKSMTCSVTGMASYMGGDSNALVSIDDEAKVIALKKLAVAATNTSIFTSVVGDISNGQGGVLGASVGIINYNTNALALISDNDSNKAGSDKDAEEKAVAGYGKMLNTALGKDANGNDVYAVQSGKKEDVLTGDVGVNALSLSVAATTDGVSNNLTVAGMSAGDGGSGDGHGMGNNESTNPAQENSNSGTTPSGSNTKPKAVIAGAGSVSWNKVSGSTAAFIDSNVILQKDKQNGGVLNLNTLDKSFIGAYSGAAAITDLSQNGKSKFSLTLEGAAAYNDIQKKTRSEIYAAELQGINTLDNKAVNSGAQVSAGLALGLEKGQRTGGGADIALGASGSLNFVNSAPQAILKNTKVKDNSANTSVNNIAYDKDVQVAGAVTLEFTKSNVSVGAAFSLNQVKNDILALVQGGEYNVLSFTNYAASKLTQVGSAISLGLNGSTGISFNFSGAVAVDNVTNKIQSDVRESTIYTKTFDGEAKDGNLSSDTAANTYIADLEKKGFDMQGNDAKKMINDGGNTVSVQDTSAQADAANVTYTKNSYKTDNSGNLQVTTAVMLDAKYKSGSVDVGAGAGVVSGNIDNDFIVTVDKSSITVKNAATALKLASSSDTLQISVAAGVAAAPSGTGANIAGSVVMQKMENDTKVTVKDSSLKADKTVMSALTKSQMIGVAGAGAGGGNAAVGFTWAQNDIANVTGVYAKGIELEANNSSVGADLTMESVNKSTLVSVAAVTAVSVGNHSASANGAVAFNHGTNDTEAIIDASTSNSTGGIVTRKSNLKKVGKVALKAEDNSTMATVAGGVGVTTSIVGAGGHYAESTIGKADKYQSTKAAINNTNITTLNNASTISLNALDNTVLTTVAAGVGVSVNTATLSIGYLDGNVITNKAYKKVEASMTATNLDIDNVPQGEKGSESSTLTLDAVNKMKMTGSADSANVSVGGYVAGGVGVATNYSYVDTIAAIYGKDAQVKSELNAAKISLKADAKNEILNVGISASGAGTASKLVTVTGAANAAINKLNNKTKAEITNSQIHTTKSVVVTADSLAKLTNIAGAASVAAGGGSGVRGALGTTVSLNDLYDDTLAWVKDSDITAKGEDDNSIKKGLYVRANGTHNLKNIAVTAGAAVAAGGPGSGAISAGADVINDNIAGSTKAGLERTDVNKDVTSFADTQNVDVLANDSITLSSTAVTSQNSVSVSSVSVSVSMGAGVTTEKITRETSANILGMNDLRRANVKGNNVNVNADTNQNFSLGNYVTALSIALPVPPPGGIPIGVAAGVTAGVGTVELKGITKANIDYVDITDVNTNVFANHTDETHLTGVAGSLAASVFSLGVGVNVYSLTNSADTAAEVRNSKILHTDNATGNDTVKAYNKSTMRNTDVAATVSIGLGAAVGVTVINNTFTENARAVLVDTVIGEENKRAKDVTLLAENNIDMEHTGVNANVGLAAVGTTVVNNALNSSTVTGITGGTVYGTNITLNSKENRKLHDTVVGAYLGAGAVNVTNVYNNLGASLQNSYVLEDGKTVDTTSMQAYVQNAYATQNAVIEDVLGNSSDGTTTKSLIDNTEIKTTDMKGTETKVYKADAVTTNSVRGANAVVNSKAVLNATGTVKIGTNVENVAKAQITSGGGALLKVGVLFNHLNLQDCSNVTIAGATIVGDKVLLGNDVTGNLDADTVDAGASAVGIGVTQTNVQRSGAISINLQDSNITANSKDNEDSILLANTNNVSLYGNVTNVTVSGVSGNALNSKVTDNSRADITIDTTASTAVNKLSGKNITLLNTVTPELKAKITGVAVGAVAGGGSKATAKENNAAIFSLKDINVSADNFCIGNTVMAVNKDGKEVDSVTSDVTAVSVALGAVAVNKAITNADINANTTLDGVKFAGFSKDAEGHELQKTDVQIINLASSKVNNDIRGVTVGALTVGSNISENTNTSKAVTTINLQDDTEVGNFSVNSLTVERGKLKTNGDGGALIDVSPLAAEVVNNVNSNSDVVFTGNSKKLKTTGDVSIIAGHGDDLTINGNAIKCTIVGGSGTRINNTINFRDNAEVKDITLDVAGDVYIGAESQSNLNKDNTRVLETGGGGGFTGATSHANNHLLTNNTVTLNNANIASDGSIVVGSYTDGDYYFDTYCQNAGIAGGNTAFMTNEWKINDTVNTTGTTSLETRREGKDITLVARENLNGSARNYVEMTAGLAGGTNSELTNDIARSNKINIGGTKTTINSKRDINLFAGMDENRKLGELALQLQSQVYCGCIMDFSSTPSLKSHITQNNAIEMNSASESVSTRHINLYADAGRESLLENTGAYKMIGKSTANQSYVSTTAGGLDGKIDRDNYVNLYGSVTAGRDNIYKIEIGKWDSGSLTNAIVVPHEYAGMVQSADNNGLPVFDMDNLADYVHVTVGDSQLTGADLLAFGFKVGVMDLRQATSKRLDEVNTLIANYNNSTGDGAVYERLVAERTRLESLMSSQQNGDVTQVVYLEVPDMVASGGNVVVNTNVFRGNGTGKINARGNAEITISNKTNLTLVTNNIMVDEPGGELIYNGTPMTGSNTTEINASIKSKNLGNVEPNFNEIKISKGTSATITVTSDFGHTIAGANGIHYSGTVTNTSPGTESSSNALYMDANGNYTKQDGKTVIMGYDASQGGKFVVHKDVANAVRPDLTPLTSDLVYESTDTTNIKNAINTYGVKVGGTPDTDTVTGDMPIKSDIYITGNVNSLNGKVKIENKYDSITIEGKSVKDAVSVNGSVVEIIATNGSITQGFTDGIVNIGGDVRKQYETFYNEAVKNLAKDYDFTGSSKRELITIPMKDGDKAENAGGWIAGGQVYVNASDININGNIQSGFGRYVANIDKTTEQNISLVVTNWTKDGSKTLSDSVVMGNAAYRVVEGGAYWSAADQSFSYHMDVYYNPSTGKLLVPDVDAAGGRITLYGRIMSTGNGRIMCLDGAYNIDVSNGLNYDLQLGNLIVNDTKGVVSIMNSGSGVITEIRRDGITTKELKGNTPVAADTHVKKNGDGTYTYTPASGLAYSWVSGYAKTNYTRYYREFMSKWWGATAYQEQDSKTLDSWEDGATSQGTYNLSKENRPDGAFISTGVSFGDKEGARVDHVSKLLSSTTIQEGAPRKWSTGYLGCHKWLGYTWRKETATKQSDTAYVNASNPINIRFIGVEADKATVNITSTAENNQKIILGGSIGNRAVYENGTDHIEKGTIKINSTNGSIVQAGGNLYGANIVLSAKNDIDDIKIVAGDVVNLDAKSTGTGSVNVSVNNARYNTPSGDGGYTKGNINLGIFGGRSAAVATLQTVGSVYYKNSAFGGAGEMAADRVNLSTTGGQIGTAAQSVVVHGGQQATGSDTLTASVNVNATGDIYLAQKEGDLRAGRIYSTNGDLTITVNKGGIIDALPYEETQGNITNDDLIAEWTKLGFFDNASKAEKTANLQAVRNKLIAERDNPDTTPERKAEINKQLESMPTTYAGWNKDKLLYTISDKIINPTAGVKSSNKDPNLYAGSITLRVANSAGLNDPNVQVIDLNTLGDVDANGNVIHLNDLKALSQADVATVKWDAENGTATITKKLAIGLRNRETGNLTVTGVTDESKVKDYVYLEVRKFHDSTMSSLGMNDIKLNKLAALGDVRLFSLGNITAASGASLDSSGLITARNLIISVGDESISTAYNIGTETAPMIFDITGAVGALATGNVYLQSAAGKDLVIANISAGQKIAAGETAVISLKADGNIYGLYEPNQPVQGYIRSEKATGKTSINMEAGGSIGSVTDRTKTIRIKNTELSQENYMLNLKAGKDIVVEGVSTAAADTEQAPAGTLYINNVTFTNNVPHTASFTVNGTLAMAGNLDMLSAGGSNVLTMKAATLKVVGGVNTTIKSDTINMQSVLSWEQDGKSTIIGKNVNLTAGVLIDNLTYGTKMAVNAEDLANSKVVQEYENKVDGSSLNRLDGNDAKLYADNLKVVSNANVDLGSQANKIHNITADAQKDIEIGSGSLQGLGTALTMSIADNADITATVINSKNAGKVGGDIRLMVYDYDSNGGDIDNKLIGKGNFFAADDIMFYDEGGSLSLPKDGGTIRADGMAVLMAESDIQAGKPIYGAKGIGIIAKKDITSLPEFMVAGEGLYVESLTGNIDANNDMFANRLGKNDGGNITYVQGNIEFVAEEGSITLSTSGAMYARDDIELRAKNSITNGQGIYSKNGDILIYTLGSDTNEGEISNSNELQTLNGSVLLYGNKGVTNTASIVAKSVAANDAEFREHAGLVTILSNTKIANTAEGDTDREVILADKGVYLVAGSGGINNSADIEVTDGDVVMLGIGQYKGNGSEFLTGVGGSLTNTGNIFTRKGNIDLCSDAALNNTGGNIYTQEGNIKMFATDTLNNASNIYTKQGDIALTAENNLTNTGNVVALDGENRNEGNVTIISKQGNIAYKMNADGAGGGGIDILGDGNLVAVTQGKLTLEAKNTADDKGKITINSSLAAGRGINITADKQIAVDAAYGLTANDGGINITSVNGKLDLQGDITTLGIGDVVLNGKNSIETKGAITVHKGDFTATVTKNPAESAGYITINKGDDGDKLQVEDGKIQLDATGNITVNTVVSAKKSIEMNADGAISNSGSITSTESNVALVGKDITNADSVSAKENIAIIALDGNVTNKKNIKATNGSVLIGAEGNGNVDKGKIINGDDTGDYIKAGQDVMLGASNQVTNYADIFAGQRATETDGGGNITYQQHGEVDLGTVVLEVGADRYAYAVAAKLENRGNIQTTYGDINLAVADELKNTGKIKVTNNGNVHIVSSNNLNQNGDLKILGKGNIIMTAGGSLTNGIDSVGAVSGVFNTQTAEGDVLITAQGDVTINSLSSIIAGTKDYDDGTYTYDKNGKIVISSLSGKVTNNSDLVKAVDSIVIAAENDVINSAIIQSYNDNISLYAGHDLQNADDKNITAGKAVFISAENDIENSGSISAQTGITIGRGQLQTGDGKTYTIDDTQNLKNLSGGVISTVYGDINLSVAETITNNADITNEHGNILLEADGKIDNSGGKIVAAEGRVTMVAGKITNGMTDENILSNTANMGAKNGIVLLALNGGLSNESTLTSNAIEATEGAAITGGDLVMMAAGTLINTHSLISEGDIIIEAGKDIQNAYTVASTQGDVEFSSKNGSVTIATDNAIYALNGNVLIEAGGAEDGHKDVAVMGDIYANGGDLQILSEHGNISNTNESGNAWGKDGTDEAKGSITLAAPEGGILNKNDLKATEDITLISKKGIIIGGNQAGSIKSIESTVSGDITIHVTGEVEGTDTAIITKSGSSVNVNGGFFYNEASLTTANGNVLIMANGYAKKNLNAATTVDTEKFDIDTEENGGMKVSIYNDKTADIFANGGSVLIAGGYSIANQGDIDVNKGRAGITSAETVSQQGGDLAIYSENGHVFLYDLPNNDGGDATHRNMLEAEGNMLFYAPNGSIFNNKDMHVVDGDIVMKMGGNMASINNTIIADNGSIKIDADGDVGIRALVSAENGAVEIAAGKNMVVGDLGDDDIIVAGENITLLAGGKIRIEGDITSIESNVVVGATNDVEDIALPLTNGLEVTGEITAVDGMVALGSQKGDIVMNGILDGNKVTVYTEDKDANIDFNGEVYVSEELVLAGNHFGDNNILDMTKVHSDNDNFVLSLFGAGRTMSGDYVVSYGDSTKLAHLNQVAVENLVIVTDGPVKIENISVGKEADIYSMGTKTSIYGVMQPYDVAAQVAYYTPGGGAQMLDLHDMFFETTIPKSNEISKTFVNDTGSFVTGSGGAGAGKGKGMSLDITSPKLQRGNGILIKDYFGQDVKNNRFSAVEITSYLDSIKAYVQYDNYFNIGMDFFERYNIIDIPDVAVNSITLNNTFRDSGIIVVRDDKKEDEYEF